MLNTRRLQFTDSKAVYYLNGPELYKALQAH